MKFYTSYFLVFSGLSHLICCGIPIVLGASTFFTNLAFYSTLNPYFELFEMAEGYLFTITSIFLVSFISLEIYNNKIKCAEEDDCCSVVECDITKKKIRTNIMLSCILYLFNCFFYISERIS